MLQVLPRLLQLEAENRLLRNDIWEIVLLHPMEHWDFMFAQQEKKVKLLSQYLLRG